MVLTVVLSHMEIATFGIGFALGMVATALFAMAFEAWQRQRQMVKGGRHAQAIRAATDGLRSQGGAAQGE